MMAELLVPGVHVEEFDSGVKAMEGMGTGAAGFIGRKKVTGFSEASARAEESCRNAAVLREEVGADEKNLFAI